MDLPALNETFREIPEALRPSVARHQANLARLLESLRAAGMDDATIETAVTTLMASYKQELMAAIKALSAQTDGSQGDR